MFLASFKIICYGKEFLRKGIRDDNGVHVTWRPEEDNWVQMRGMARRGTEEE